MIYTSNYNDSKTNKYKRCSISGDRGKSVGYEGEYAKELAPKRKFWNIWHNNIGKKDEIENNKYYIKEYYNQVLKDLDPKEFYKKLDGKILLCFEKANEFCHRHIVAAYLEIKLGIEVKEIKVVNEQIKEESKPTYIKEYLEKIIKNDITKLSDLKPKYDQLQNKYGEKSLDSIYYGGLEKNPDIFFVFMNPTGKNIASNKMWLGRKSTWLGTKNIWKLFNKTNLLSNNTYEEILNKKKEDWDYEFCDKLYKELEDNKIFITNLGKCTQIDARPLEDKVLKKYLKLLLKEISLTDPKIIITFGNQVSSIILDKKISVKEERKKYTEKKVGNKTYKIYPVYYPVGNGIFNIDKAIDDINYIKEKEDLCHITN